MSPPVVSHNSSSQRSIKCSHKTPTCIGDTAAAGGVFMGLGLRGVRGIVAAAGLGTRRNMERKAWWAWHCSAEQQRLLQPTLTLHFTLPVLPDHTLRISISSWLKSHLKVCLHVYSPAITFICCLSIILGESLSWLGVDKAKVQDTITLADVNHGITSSLIFRQLKR